MRRAGVLLHPTALPQGVLDENVELFLSWMSRAGLSVWQMLPLGAPHSDRSPYQAYSAYALNPALLPAAISTLEVDADKFLAFTRDESAWLDDYALFVTLSETHNHQPWSQWPIPYRYRHQDALEKFSAAHEGRLHTLKRQQYLLFQRWQEIKKIAHSRGIIIFGDLPIAVSYDSADVWAQPGLFKLDEQLQPTVVAGVPPDYFSRTGQRWGNPHYNWEQMQSNHFAWWRARMASALRQFDLVRIDHFRGLQALWEIPATAETAAEGEWVETPGYELLEALQDDFPHMPFVAEDLGIINAEVIALRNAFKLPSLSVLQFGFSGDGNNPHSVFNQVENSVVYTGTHDNNTTCGWFNSLDPDLQQQVLQQLPQDVGSMPWPLIEAALQSPAKMAIIPMQDWLGLDEKHRTNTPGTTENNWSWKFSWDQIPPQLATTIRAKLERSRRFSSRGDV